MFLDSEMALFFNFAFAVPADSAPSEFSDQGMVSIPCLEVQRTPSALLLSPVRPNTLKDITPCVQCWIHALQALIIFLDLLLLWQRRKIRCRYMRPPSTHLQCSTELFPGLEVDGGDMPKTGLGQEAVRVWQGNGVLGKLHGMQPIPHIFDLGGREQ